MSAPRLPFKALPLRKSPVGHEGMCTTKAVGCSPGKTFKPLPLAERGQSGDAERAISYYERSLEACEVLLRANPSSGQAARHVSFSLERLAAFLATRGQSGALERALSYFERSLELREALVQANPGSAQAARDVTVSLINLAGLLSSRGQRDAERALIYYERSLEVDEALLDANSRSAQAARGQAGDAERAIRYYECSLEAGEVLLGANPQSAQAVHDVWVSLVKLAELFTARGQAGDAESALGRRSQRVRRAPERADGRARWLATARWRA
ncbi:tetratricopeptide repeat protein [Aquincola sp. S2]|uniref:Tetratricopeptide repeat protein n=1 Tax=Pseudaquabacterium terrae TaxID=2732868 RepID=A0ABX2ERR7_9BURK|nr:tetratricopeptide repeat protein [Aquabacterium terrae]NRF71215.1 tetratricopeptide repeat protein [Aquabacterium terrae]